MYVTNMCKIFKVSSYLISSSKDTLKLQGWTEGDVREHTHLLRPPPTYTHNTIVSLFHHTEEFPQDPATFPGTKLYTIL